MRQTDPPRGQPPRGQPRPEQAPEPPRSLLAAVWSMYAGAALSAIQLVLALATIGGLRAAIHQAHPSYPASRVHSIEVSYVASGVITQLLAIGLWVVMALASRSGRSWARAAASSLFAVNTLLLVYAVRQPIVSIGLAFYVAIWLAGLSAVAALWRRDSTAFFAASTESRRS
jgi:hypothetical protein